MKLRISVISLLLVLMGACGNGSNGIEVDLIGPADGRITRRETFALVAGCAPSAAESAAFARGDVRAQIDEIILVCLAAHADGSTTPNASAATASAAPLRAQGYRVSLAVSFTASGGGTMSGFDVGRLLSTDPARSALVANLVGVAPSIDGIDLDWRGVGGLRHDPGAIQDSLEDISRARPLSVLVSSTANPQAPCLPVNNSDCSEDCCTPVPPDLSILDLSLLSRSATRLHYVPALSNAGPQVAPGEDVDRSREAAGQLAGPAVDVPFPLGSVDGTRRLSFGDATALLVGGSQRKADGELTDASGAVWIVDATTISRVMRALEPPVLDARAGIVFEGVGDADPAVWTTLAALSR